MNKCTVTLFTFIFIFFIAGCTSTKNPDEQLKERVQLTEDILKRYKIDDHWWQVYNDQQLNQLVELAMKNNIDLAKRAIDINRALYQANLIGEDLVPTFSAGTDGSIQKSIKTGDASTRAFSGKINISYEVDLWQKIANTVSAQQWEYAATVQDRETTRLALINNVVDAYYHLMYLHQAITITEQTIENYQQISQLVFYKYQYGRVSSLDPAQAKQAILNARNNLIDLQNQLKTTEQTLRDLLNLKPAEPLLINYPDLLTLQLPKVDLNVPLSVIANRPDLRAAEYRLQKASLDLQATEKSWYPTITLGAAVNSSSDKVRTAFDVPLASGNIAINLPFLEWNRIRWRIKISKEDYEGIRLDLEKAITTALNEISTYYYNYTNAQTSLANLQDKYNYDIQITQYYDIRYQQGAGELKDWLDALNTETNTKISLLSSRYQLIQYENQIYKAIAGRYLEQ